MKLYELPQRQGIRIKAQTLNGNAEILGQFIIFHHIDGAYSYCTVEGHPNEVCHLSASQELKKEESNDYYELN